MNKFQKSLVGVSVSIMLIFLAYPLKLVLMYSQSTLNFLVTILMRFAVCYIPAIGVIFLTYFVFILFKDLLKK